MPNSRSVELNIERKVKMIISELRKKDGDQTYIEIFKQEELLFNVLTHNLQP
jgi:hypothetical protein